MMHNLTVKFLFFCTLFVVVVQIQTIFACDYAQVLESVHTRPYLGRNIVEYLPVEHAQQVCRYYFLAYKKEIARPIFEDILTRVNKVSKSEGLGEYTADHLREKLYCYIVGEYLAYDILPKPGYWVISTGKDMIHQYQLRWDQPLRIVSLVGLDRIERAEEINVIKICLNPITFLFSPSFDSFSHLGELDLSNNSIEDIAPNTFATLSKLFRLHLNGNKLSHLRNGVLNGLVSLYELVICDNKVATIDDNFFSPVGKLITLELQRNPLKTLPEDMFKYLENLSSIRFDDCSLTTLPVSLTKMIERNSVYGNGNDARKLLIFLRGNKEIGADTTAQLAELPGLEMILD